MTVLHKLKERSLRVSDTLAFGGADPSKEVLGPLNFVVEALIPHQPVNSRLQIQSLKYSRMSNRKK